MGTFHWGRVGTPARGHRLGDKHTSGSPGPTAYAVPPQRHPDVTGRWGRDGAGGPTDRQRQGGVLPWRWGRASRCDGGGGGVPYL